MKPTGRRGRSRAVATLLFGLLLVASPASSIAEAQEDPLLSDVLPLLQQFCFDCHGPDEPEARFALESIALESTVAERFRDWRKVLDAVERFEMPPPDGLQPTDAERTELVTGVRGGLRDAAEQHAEDPGRTIIRRLTSAEFAYTIHDLTGVDLHLDRDFVSDAVGGEGFTNVGTAQFIQDSTLERYLDAAKKVASHAVIGAGPLQFHDDPGATGLELSAITRIQKIYRDHGFRALAGEGGEPFGMDYFPKAFYAAWRYRHRESLGLAAVTLTEFGAAEGLTPRFVEHVWSLLSDPSPRYPVSDVIAAWNALPAPNRSDAERPQDQQRLSDADEITQIRQACDDVFNVVQRWHMRLIQPTSNAEDSPVLNPAMFEFSTGHSFAAPLTQQRVGGGGLVQDTATLPIRFSTSAGSPNQSAAPLVIWKNPRLRLRGQDRTTIGEQRLRNLISDRDAAELRLGVHPGDRFIGDGDFVLAAGEAKLVHVSIPRNARSVYLLVDVEIDAGERLKESANANPDVASDELVHVEIVQLQPGAEESREWVRSSSAVLAEPDGNPARLWREGILDFVEMLPFLSHREAAPSDRDPIPEPFDNTYNMPERDRFHSSIKYHRDDDFLFNNILDDETREQLEEAWADLLTSFEHHDNYLQFTCEKFGIELGNRGIAAVDAEWIELLPEPPRSIIAELRDEFEAASQELLETRPRHLDNLLEFAERAWRRPLTRSDRNRLLSFYEHEFEEHEQDHSRAIRAVLARILVSPEFLYRAVRPAEGRPVPISDWELASRLSYFLWSSVPDDELRTAAAAGTLSNANELERQARRMLRDPRSRRLAAEFFGQWFGFYQFDRFSGIDHQQFPEFTEELRQSLLEEATRFFEHLIREDRPVADIVFADYTFLDAELAAHYGVAGEFEPDVWARVDRIGEAHRGGVLGLGAVLTANSGAPLRTSPVRRGDWILRRLLGTPVPPPPADAGSIPAEEVLGDGLTVRQRLEAHRDKPACMGCHSRIDPLGFALENFDSLGRWRESYLDGKPVIASGTLTNGSEISGWDGLRTHLHNESHRIETTLSTKLLGYATGRAESISDVKLIDEMRGELERDPKFSSLVVKIVTSRQFRYHRGHDEVPAETLSSHRPRPQGDEE